MARLVLLLYSYRLRLLQSHLNLTVKFMETTPDIRKRDPVSLLSLHQHLLSYLILCLNMQPQQRRRNILRITS